MDKQQYDVESSTYSDISQELDKNSYFDITHHVRELTCQEQDILEKDKKCVSDFKQKKLEEEAQKNWDLFYKRNTTKFFKDRHWTKREFAELAQRNHEEGLVVFEVGCGVGNFMFPLLQEDSKIFFYACDFSKRAIMFVKENPSYCPERCVAFHCDITADGLTSKVPECSVDVATMIFVLSSIHPDRMITALMNIFKVLKPGGCLLLRDYGLFDHAMLRFSPGHKLSEHFYVRQDGTRAYYFTIEELADLFQKVGYVVTTCDYVQRQTVNQRKGLAVPRIFVQGKFLKPISDENSEYNCCLMANNELVKESV